MTPREEFQAEFDKLGYQWSEDNQEKAFLGWQLCAALAAASLREKEDAAHMFADFLLLKHCHAFINHENITKYLTEFDAQRLGREKESGK